VVPSGNESKTKSKPIVNANVNRDGPNGKAAMPNTAQTNGGGAVSKSPASAAIVEAVHSHSNRTASLNNAKVRNEFVREVLTLIHTDPSFVDRLWAEYRAGA